MNTYILLIIAFIIVGCSSMSEKTISTMDGSTKPAWATQEKAFSAKDGKLMILGFQELEADAKVSAAFRLSDNSARGELSKMIQTHFSSILQNLEEGVADEGSLTRYYSSEVSKNMLRELKITHRFWEKVQTFDRDGEKTYRLRVYSLAEIPENRFKKLMRESLDKDKLDPEVKKQVLNHFEGEIGQFQAN